MGKALAAGITLLVIFGIIIGGMYILGSVNPDTGKVPDTLTIKFTATDKLAGSTDAATTMIDIYMIEGDYYVKQERVTLTAAQTESANTYTTGQKLFLHIFDLTDTSLCTLYRETTVPYASWAEQNDGSFQMKINTVDKGDTAKDILIKYSNNTAITASSTMDVTNNSFDSNYCYLDLELRALDDDSGYVNTDNFLRGYSNNHYLILSASGTGYDSVNLLTTGWTSFERGSVRYFVKQLSDEAITRDLQSTGEYDPEGKVIEQIAFDFTGFESGDSVTFTYQYRWYASMDYFQEGGSWGVNSAATSESITIQY